MQYLFAILVLVALVVCALGQYVYSGYPYGYAGHAYNYGAYPYAYNYAGYNPALSYFIKK